jgi:hypothetical protein
MCHQLMYRRRMHSILAVLATTPESSPAGGAELMQVVGATAVGGVLTFALLALGFAHRSGRSRLLARVAAGAERATGLPGWAALPTLIAGQTLLVAVGGMYWDISLHIDNGRDPGPLANPAHYLILFGLFGLFAAGFLALVLPRERPGSGAVRLTGDWHVPVGGLVLMACGAFALIGFPLDDVSHRLFGQDVTLWGPTHLMLIGGAGLSLFGMLILLAEGRQVHPDAPATAPAAPGTRRTTLLALAMRARVAGACGGLLIGMSVYQGEFDFGVPQFRLLFQPLLIAVAAGVALTCARMVLGRGGALAAVAFFLVIRGGLSLLVGGVFDQTTPHFPLYMADGLLVEAVALALGTQRALRFGLVSGALIGTVGTLAEWGWSHVWMPLPWPAHMMGDALALTLPTGVAAGLLGAFAAGGLLRRPEVTASALGRRDALAAVAVIVAAVALLAPTSGGDGLRAAVTLAPATGDRVVATVRFSDPAQVRDADWLSSLAWQGRARLHNRPLHELAPGVFRSEPMPVGGTWKTLLRLHRGSTLAAVPVFLPEDRAIPAAGVSASPRFERTFVADSRVLQRERKDDVPGWLWGAAGLVVLALFAALLALMGWAFARIAKTGGSQAPPSTPGRSPRRSAEAPQPAADLVPAGTGA